MAELKPVQLDIALLLASGVTITAAAQSANITRQTVHKWLNDADFIAHLNGLKSESVEAAGAALRASAVSAVECIINLMVEGDNPAVKLAAAKEVLSLLGIDKNSLRLPFKGAICADDIAKAQASDRRSKALSDSLMF
ncbi:MAG: hypothetical protein NTV00_07850 [Methylococcales bacterium]|nr:hypothetical protein [Methylococcales bacterium]